MSPLDSVKSLVPPRPVPPDPRVNCEAPELLKALPPLPPTPRESSEIERMGNPLILARLPPVIVRLVVPPTPSPPTPPIAGSSPNTEPPPPCCTTKLPSPKEIVWGALPVALSVIESEWKIPPVSANEALPPVPIPPAPAPVLASLTKFAPNPPRPSALIVVLKGDTSPPLTVKIAEPPLPRPPFPPLNPFPPSPEASITRLALSSPAKTVTWDVPPTPLPPLAGLDGGRATAAVENGSSESVAICDPVVPRLESLTVPATKNARGSVRFSAAVPPKPTRPAPVC